MVQKITERHLPLSVEDNMREIPMGEEVFELSFANIRMDNLLGMHFGSAVV